MVRVLVCIYIFIQAYIVYRVVSANIASGKDFNEVDILKIIEIVCLSVALFVLAKRSREQMLKNRNEDNK